jgi:hypothetical protein
MTVTLEPPVRPQAPDDEGALVNTQVEPGPVASTTVSDTAPPALVIDHVTKRFVVGRKKKPVVKTEADAVVERLRAIKAQALRQPRHDLVEGPILPAAGEVPAFRAPEVEIPPEAAREAKPPSAPAEESSGYLDRLKEAKKRAQK